MQIQFVTSALLLLGLAGCVTPRNTPSYPEESVSVSAIRLLDEDGNVCNFLMEPVVFSMASREFMLGHVLTECDRRLTNRTVHVAIHARDCRPVADPNTAVIYSDELHRIYQDDDDPRAKGSWNSEFQWQQLTDMIEMLAIPDKYAMNTHSDPDNLYFRIGPAEFTRLLVDRRAYSVPEHLHDSFAALPSTLRGRGYCLAFDPSATTVVAIDERGSSTFALLEALGCTKIDRKKSNKMPRHVP